MERPDAPRRDEELEALLRTVDHAAPRLRANAVIERARRRAMRRSVAAAALGLVTVAGVAAAATPGSPVRRFIASLVPAHGTPARAPAAPRATAAPPAGPRGVAFVPGRSVVVAFRDTQPAGVLRVRLVDDRALRLSPDHPVGGYSLDDHGVTVNNAGSVASFDLRLPRGVAHGRITVRGRTVLTKEGAQVRGAGATDAHGDYVIPLRGTTPGP